ncbi:unnamed protein product [Paramecium sonneborni]|uniref:Uncharacterized protein n=1 Tax=Paramecium sonneborni TaxID=65129 RepID=A0A8S1NKN8_9CILI|nr:unnamed protein product [Paramecium sonneborni]
MFQEKLKRTEKSVEELKGQYDELKLIIEIRTRVSLFKKYQKESQINQAKFNYKLHPQNNNYQMKNKSIEKMLKSRNKLKIQYKKMNKSLLTNHQKGVMKKDLDLVRYLKSLGSLKKIMRRKRNNQLQNYLK